MDTNEINGYLKQYDNMTIEYIRIYDKFIKYAQMGNIQAAEDLKIPLRQINTILVKIRKKLDSYPEIPGYNKECGESINDISEKLDVIIEDFSAGTKESIEAEINTYRNDGQANYNEIPKEHARKAAEEYGEGYAPLIDFLELCFENGITTYASCAGHNENDTAYVLFDASDERTKKLAEYLSKNKIADTIGIWKFNKAEEGFKVNEGDKEDSVFIAIHANMENRDNFFRCSIEQMKEIIEENNKGENVKNNESQSFVREIIMLLEQYKFDEEIMLDVKREKVIMDINALLMHFNIEYEPEEFLQQLQLDATGDTLIRKSKVIEAIKEICISAKTGLEAITSTKLLFMREKDKEKIGQLNMNQR